MALTVPFIACPNRFEVTQMDIQHFHDALQGFLAADSVDEITRLCRLQSQQLGFDAFVYALRIPTRVSEARLIVINGYPEAWISHYFESDFNLHDPVLAHCKKHVVPLEWHAPGLVSSAESARVMNEATEFGLRFGISVPVHTPHGELGVLSLALNQRLVAAQEITRRALPYAQLMASYVHEAVYRVFSLAADRAEQTLTAREQECLRWAADGKTSWEIARLLNLSERTVNFHLNNATIKLDACNRQHAVVRAVLGGLIQHRPF
jgi:DNA-binding CsgD family transcriptional regulator